MKLFVVLLLCLLGNSLASVIKSKEIIQLNESDRVKLERALKQLEGGDKSILDELPNIIFDLIVSAIGNSDFDPMGLPDIKLDFEEGRLTGDLQLTEGEVGGFSEISRAGDAEVNLFILERRANVKIPVFFEELGLSYRYFARLGLLGVDGTISGGFVGITTVLDIDINLANMDMSLNEFSIDANDFRIRFDNNPWTDWTINLLLRIITSIAKEPILEAVESVLEIIFGIIFGGI
ncbi:uncharacterized protein [Onthophagus taurus]|uniref:uncharacterized protein n=1 Tax=Onthophagus taurus TaxID=166361 RepID=UPI0039BDD8A3